ncbi:hypothetical protein BCR42DRAFT_424205 [Absidia repens]|uniref:Alginate lyase domain-containing protein n=1 Tax=Absidia repens TaxID=90262 RepID=A0A1X2I5H3_9FUNG|nr:hypothetical protein BCR42DRAFT_424205 [Absidia repens]
MIPVEFRQNTSGSRYYKDKPPRFVHLPARAARKYRQQPRWIKLLLLSAGLMLLFGYVPYFSFVKDLSSSTTPPIPKQDSQQQQQQPTAAVSRFSGIAREQVILYRIIGNDLPPRHKEGQTLSNLQFILEHEPDFPNTRKIFVLNRISNPVNEATIIRLLDRHHIEYLRLPFEENVYKQLDFRLEDFTEPDFLHSDDYRRYSKVAKLRVLDYTYHDKNLYAMNNNGGRNAAIEHARTIKNAKWIMPFDGNCFLSYNGFREIKAQLDQHGSNTKYFTVPMTRLLNNSVLLNDLDERPKAPEEPQIIFRHDATEQYNLNMRYGRRSKLELLWTLGALENRRLSRPTVPWEPSERPFSQDKGNFRSIGWVFRLFSGNPRQEENKKEASSIRAFNRLLAIQSSLDSLDESIARRDYQQDKMFLYNDKEMNSIRNGYRDKKGNNSDINHHIIRAVEHLKARAETIMDDHLTPPSTSLPQQSSSSSFEYERLGALSQNVTILTLAHHFLDDERYGKMATHMIRVQLLESKVMANENQHSYSFPGLGRLSTTSTVKHHHASFSSSSSADTNKNNSSNSNHGSILRLLSLSDLTKTDMSYLLDSIRFLRRMQLLTDDEYTQLQSIAGELLEYFVTSPAGIHLAQMTDHRGVLYDLQVTSLAAFTNDVQLFLRVANRCRMRIGKQFTANGNQPYQQLRLQSMMMMMVPDSSQMVTNKKEQDEQQQQEISSTQQKSWQQALLHYESLNLHYWLSLTRGIQNTGMAKDIWHYTAANGGSISHSVTKHLQSYAQLTMMVWKDEEDRAWANSKLRPLLLMANKAFQHATPPPSSLSIQQQQQQQQYEADRVWVEKATALDLFGNAYTIDHTSINSDIYQQQQQREEEDPTMSDMLKSILDDHATGQPSIVPFWTLGNL